jgi:hypothetical protein
MLIIAFSQRIHDLNTAITGIPHIALFAAKQQQIGRDSGLIKQNL